MSGSSNYTRTPNYSLYKPVPEADDDAWGTHLNWNADTLDTALVSIGGALLAASSFGGIWDGAHDVSGAIIAAIAAATAAGGGTVTLPAGSYPIASQLVINTSGVGLRGSGTGMPRDSASPGAIMATTRLIWTGAAGATMLLIRPGGGVSLNNNDVIGVAFDGASLADVCCRFTQVNYSTIRIGVSEPRMAGAVFDTMPGAFEGPGTQYNEIWVTSRSTSATYSPTGILFDSGVGSLYNVSGNHIHMLNAWFAKGDGIVCACMDANLIDYIAAAPDPVNHGGTPLVFANAGYVQKNGWTSNGPAVSNIRVLKMQTSGLVCGLRSGSTIVPGVHVGTAAVATVTLVTNAITPLYQGLLNFAATTGVAVGMVANGAGGWSSGVGPNVSVVSVTGTVVGMAFPTVGQVASGTSVTFSYGITAQAVPGMYTLTAVNATTWNVTAPAGGHSQSNVAVAGNVLSLTDMVIPLSGTPTAGDTFVVTIVSSGSAYNLTLESFDDGNAVPPPIVEPGGIVFTTSTGNPFPRPLGGTGEILIEPTNINGRIILGGGSSAAANSAGVAVGGIGNSVGGVACAIVGGNNNSVSGYYTTAQGQGCATSGFMSFAGGAGATDRAHWGALSWASGNIAVQGDAQTRITVLRGSGSAATAFRLTADGGGASSNNVVNIPANSAFGVTIRLHARNSAVAGTDYNWVLPNGLLSRDAGVGTTLLAQGTPAILTRGTVTGAAASVTADTVNGGLNVSFTPPTGNAAAWHAVARIETVELQ